MGRNSVQRLFKVTLEPRRDISSCSPPQFKSNIDVKTLTDQYGRVLRAPPGRLPRSARGRAAGQPARYLTMRCCGSPRRARPGCSRRLRRNAMMTPMTPARSRCRWRGASRIVGRFPKQGSRHFQAKPELVAKRDRTPVFVSVQERAQGWREKGSNVHGFATSHELLDVEMTVSCERLQCMHHHRGACTAVRTPTIIEPRICVGRMSNSQFPPVPESQ